MTNEVSGHILVVDDEANARRVLSAILGEAGYGVVEAESARDARKVLGSQDVDVVISDVRMPEEDGIELQDHIAEHYPDIPVIFLTAYGDVESAVSAMTKGAFYYFVKPPNYADLKGILSRAVDQRQLKRELQLLREKLGEENRKYRIIGRHPEIRRIFETIESIKDSESSVLITGETGTGKELVARALHFEGIRGAKPFVAVNCAAIPKDLIESELFGHEKGAFTGAATRRIGRVEQASGGTLFLDEIGELDLSIQAKLLRVLQEKEVDMLGSNKRVSVDFRLISSTNRNLEAEVKKGQFREDLFYRINVVQLRVPSLRQRRSDIPLLAAEFVKEFCRRENKLLTLSARVLEVFQDYSWPGNIRQLRNVLERAVVLARGREISVRELPDDLFALHPSAEKGEPGKTIKEMEAQAIVEALDACGGNKSKASKMLGLSRKALYKRLHDYRILG
ncbi:sigma-54 dependent transcriptional regulator [Desulfuromonas sp. AOP6]|uniref:sigma-54-dependent transcriptional regulator n=1 Tax=Desulfuromonas sp. AOP6 TaxID=1566351 RepID=UPI00126B9966|nr:sigma-54 dependent transcriptional regulator [Desulfuromonas sp. AOP6]BCA79474.1 sigma-54-dependent Fis family transcriptional regulator [Desulfuromonas sp. AOP6]